MRLVRCLLQSAIALAVVAIWSTLAHGWITNTPLHGPWGDAGFNGDNGSLQVTYGLGDDTWANALGQLNAYNAKKEHEIAGGIGDMNWVTGSIESSQPLWVMTASARAFAQVSGSQLAGLGGHMQVRADASLIMDGTWSRWTGSSVELNQVLDPDAPVEFYGMDLGTDASGQQRMVEVGGERRGFADYPQVRILLKPCQVDWNGAATQQDISFAYSTGSGCDLKFQFATTDPYPFMNAAAKQTDAGNPDCAPWAVHVMAFDGSTLVESRVFR